VRRIAAGAGTLEGLLVRTFQTPVTFDGWARRRPIETLGRRRARELAPAFREARERSPGGSPARSLAERTLEGEKPTGASSGRRANPMLGCQGLAGGSKPRSRGPSFWPGVSHRVSRRDKRQVGASPVVTPGIPSGRRMLRRVNPMSAVGMKQDRHGLGGSKPSRG
jgi:hypothetical protein